MGEEATETRGAESLSNDNNGSRSSLRSRKRLSRKSKSKKWKWTYRTPVDLTKAHETTFLNMQLRKTNRALTGTKHRNTNYEFLALACFLVLIYSVGTQTQEDDLNDPNFVTLTLGEVIAIGVWLFVATFVTTTFRESRFIELMYWMLVYLPLLAALLVFLFDNRNVQNGNLNVFSYGQVIGIFLIVAECLALSIFLCIYYLYPRWINSSRFRRNSRAAKFWRIKMLGDWTMTYRGTKGVIGKRFTCKYQGETNQDGLPHGQGQWFDDSYEGEVLAGTWRDGVPVAPFVSRHYGRGDAFSAVRIAYIMASDDEFNTTKFWPSNEKPPRCGVAGVECSVAGSFYNELPCASVLIGPDWFNEKTSVGELCSNLTYVGDEADMNILHINANDPRGVQINGYVHSATGEAFNTVDEIIIKLKPEKRFSISPLVSPRMEYMPMSYRSFRPEKLVARDEQEDDSEQSAESSPPRLSVVPESELDDEDEDQGSLEEGFQAAQQKLSLAVEGWKPSEHRDALVYVGGFNCGLKEALENLGQFMAMTKLDTHVYPILFEWPVGTVLTYHSASRASHRDQNRKNFLALMKGLQNAGIRNVHFMSHSMGAQTLLGSFCDKPDGSRSDVSRCFRLAPDCDEEEKGIRSENGENGNGQSENDDNLLICKTLTMLNPDFPVKPFVNHAFRSIRRICQTITLVGDRSDGALFFSQLVNGIGVYFGYEQPDALLPNTENKEHLRYLHVIGRNIEDLHFPPETLQTTNQVISSKTAATSTSGNDSNRSNSNEAYLQFSERAPLTLVSKEDELEKAWLDLDVIDTTGLDTNIADIRHNAFVLNPILLNDIEELIRTGNRAMKRSSLLYRDGNLFSYCHAPSYVAF